MSDSDGAEDDGGRAKERRRAKKKAAITTATPVVTIEEMPADDPPDPFERLEVQEMLEVQKRPAVKESKKNSEKQESRIRTG